MNNVDKVWGFFNCVIENSNGHIQSASKVKDDSSEPDPTADYFIKLNGKRLGRDIRFYVFMATLDRNIIPPTLMEEIVLIAETVIGRSGPIRKYLAEWGNELYEDDQLEKWKDILGV
jgi:hypothetical protein